MFVRIAPGLPYTGPYAASKHALHGFFDGLRMELSRKMSSVGIVTAILGSIDTERYVTIHAKTCNTSLLP